MNWFVLCVQLNIIRSTKCIKVNDEVWQKFSHFRLVALACLFFVLFCKNGSFSKSHFLSQHTLKKVLCSELNVQKIFKKCLNWIMPTVCNVLSFESSGGIFRLTGNLNQKIGLKPNQTAEFFHFLAISDTFSKLCTSSQMSTFKLWHILEWISSIFWEMP